MAKILSLTSALALLMAQPAFACASCMGKADGKTGAAITAAMGLLLVMVLSIACLFTYLLYSLIKQDGSQQ